MIEWIVEATSDERFPYRLSIVEADRTLLCLRIQERWPGPKGQVFCLRDDSGEVDGESVVERERVTTYRPFGRRLIVTLDRPQRKRCDFLFLQREYKGKPGSYEQIFFRTESAVRQHRNRGRRELYGRPALQVVIDAAERYPWTFPGAEVRREALPVGDYALEIDGRIAAIVERKTYENMLQEVARVRSFHQQLSDLARLRRSALVIEAAYADFSDPKRLAGRYSGGYVSGILAELTALHPRVQIVYAGTRKHGAQWTHGFFTAEAARLAQREEDVLSVAEEEPEMARLDPHVGSHEVRRDILGRLEEFRMKDLAAAHPDIPPDRIRRVVSALRGEGRIVAMGRASGVRYRVVDKGGKTP